MSRLGLGISVMPGPEASPWPRDSGTCRRRRRRYTTMAIIPSNITASAVHPTASLTTVGLTPLGDDEAKLAVGSAVFAVADAVAVANAVARENAGVSESLQRICRGYATIQLKKGLVLCVPIVPWLVMPVTTQTLVGVVRVFWHAHHGSHMLVTVWASGQRYSLWG